MPSQLQTRLGDSPGPSPVIRLSGLNAERVSETIQNTADFIGENALIKIAHKL